jgi:hypothetical protein
VGVGENQPRNSESGIGVKIVHKLSKNTQVEIEASTQIEAFEKLGALSEVFGQSACGHCESANIHPRVRVVEGGHKYPEWACRDCGATLSYGQHRSGGTLFPKGAWSIYRPEKS